MRRVRKFLSLSLREKILLLKAAILVCHIRLELTFLSFSSLQNLLTKTAKRQIHSTPSPKYRFSVDQLAGSFAAVCHYVPKATCLIQALAIQVLLWQEGYPANLQIGARKDEEGRLQAHAWVESQG